MDTDCASERTGKQMLRECPYTACWGKALQAENARLKALLSHSKTQLEYDELQAENDKLKEIASLALDIHTRDPLVVSAKWGFTGPKAEELLVVKIEALKG